MRSAKTIPTVLAMALMLSAAPAAAQGPAAAAPALTIGDALAQMRASHESLKALDKERAQREEERKATRSLYWPQVEASGNYTRLDNPIELDLDPIRQVILTLHPQVPASRVPAFIDTVQDETFWKTSIQATWPIYTGGKVAAATHAAEARVQDVEQQRKQVEQSLATDLVRRYYGLRLAMNARDVRADVLEGLDRHLRDATRLEEEGLISRAERLHASVARADADRQLKRAEQDVAIARAGLANILSVPSVGDPASPLVMGASVESMQNFQDTAQKLQPAFGRFEAQHKLAAQALKAEQGRWLPDVYLFGLRELHEADLTVLDPKWAVGVGFKYTLFDGFDRQHRTAAAKIQAQRVNDLEARARRDVATLVEKRYRDLMKAREQFGALDAALELGQENLRVRTRAFEEGFGTSLDVVDARLSLSRVQLERLVAAYEFDVAVAELLEASGETERFEQILATGKPVTK